MPTLSLEGFDGIIPRDGPSRLGASNATIALNVKMMSGELRPWRLAQEQYTSPISNVQGIYQLIGPSNATEWLEWPYDVDIVEAPMADNGDYRIYGTGASAAPFKTNWSMATSGTGTNYPYKQVPMGVPAPQVAPTLTPSSTTSPESTFSYVYTYVNQFGTVLEESAPSPAATVSVLSSGTVTVSGFDTTSITTAAGYNPVFINIYRSVSGNSSVQYQQVTQLAWGTTSYVDPLSQTALGAVLPSTYWTPPPSTLRGLVEMPNGMLAGFVGNQVWFCEAYYPHAWPVTYMQTVEYPIVGLGVFGNSLFVGTIKNPYLLTGTTPGAMTMEKLPIIQACVSKRSIVSDQWGVVYASPNGLLAVGPGVQDVVSQGLFTRDEWQAINPSSLIGLLYNNMYMGFYVDANGVPGTMVYTRNDHPALVNFDFHAQCGYVSKTNNNVYAVNAADNNIYQIDADYGNWSVYQWKSRLYIMPEPTNFGAFKMQADWSTVTQPNITPPALSTYVPDSLEGTLNSVQMNYFQIDGSLSEFVPTSIGNGFVQVTIYGDGNVLYQSGVFNDEPIRMPGGVKCQEYQVLISGNVSVRKFTMATTIGELRRV